MKGKRIEWLDYAKGIGIILVIFAHTDIPLSIKKYIFTFHMPLFFFLSGYLFSPNKYENRIHLLRQRLKTLIIPYFCFSLISILWIIVVDRNFDVPRPILGIFISNRNSNFGNPDGTLWFLTCLFITELLFYEIVNATKDNDFITFLTLIFCSGVGFMYAHYVKQTLPWSIDASLIAVAFYGMAYLLRKQKFRIASFNNWSFLILLALVNIYLGQLNSFVSMFSNAYGNYFLFYGSAVTGIGFITLFAKNLKDCMPLLYLGKNSLTLLALHQDICFGLIWRIIAHFNITRTTVHGTLLWGIAFTAFTLIFTYPVIKFFNYYTPFVIGKGFERIV